MTLIIYFLLAYGISNWFVFSMGPFHVFDKIRNYAAMIHPQFGELMNCMICFPSWVGIILSLLNYFLIPVPFTPFNILFAGANVNWLLIALFDSAITSGVVWLINTLQEALETRYEEDE